MQGIVGRTKREHGILKIMLAMREPLKHNTAIMNRLNIQQRTKIIAALCEGNSLRAAAATANAARTDAPAPTQ
jgi:hypothetical protein